MLNLNYELKAHLNNLTLTATDHKLDWIGTEQEREKARLTIELWEDYEREPSDLMVDDRGVYFEQYNESGLDDYQVDINKFYLDQIFKKLL